MPDDVMEVSIPDDMLTGRRRSSAPKPPKFCDVCGVELEDRRSNRCAEHKETKTVRERATSGASKRRGRAKGLSPDIADGLTSVAAKLLFLITLMYAWAMLRRNRVPDPDGNIAEQMAMTDDEATIVGRVLSRFFASSDVGKRLAPSIVQNEDLIDAAFVTYEWYKRNANIWDELESRGYIGQQAVPPERASMTMEGARRNGSTRPVEEDRGEEPGDGGPIYVPPSVQDIIGGV